MMTLWKRLYGGLDGKQGEGGRIIEETENRPLSLKAVKRQYSAGFGEELSLYCPYPDNIMAENMKYSKILL